MQHKQLISWRQINNFLTVSIILVCSYIIILPILPAVQFWIAERLGVERQLPYPVHSYGTKPNSKPKTTTKPTDNRLIIPSAHINEPLVQGGPRNLDKGIWAVPHTSTPDVGSNTVLAGHRFMYTNALFYNLDKVRMDDIVAIFWQGKEYNYRVNSVSVVRPTATEIQNPSEEPMLTMYTCTPLWTSKNRLVVRAKLIYKES